MSKSVLVILFFSLGLVCEVHSHSLNDLWTTHNPMRFVVTACILFTTREQFASASPVQGAVITGATPGRTCLESADCDVEKQYCDMNIKRCLECSVLCKEERKLLGECRIHCLAYTLLLKNSKVTTKDVTTSMFTTTVRGQTESIGRSSSFFVQMTVIITIVLVGIFVLMLIIMTFLLMRKRCRKPKPHIATPYHEPVQGHTYSTEPTSRSKEVPRECEKQTLLTDLPSNSPLDSKGLSDSKVGGGTSHDSGIVITDSTFPSNEGSVETQPSDSLTVQPQDEPSKRMSESGEKSFPKNCDITSDDLPVHMNQSGKNRHQSDPLSNTSQHVKSEYQVKGETSVPTRHKDTSEPRESKNSVLYQRASQKPEHNSNSKGERRSEPKSSQDELLAGKLGSCNSRNPEANREGKPLLKDYEEQNSVYPSETLPPQTKAEPKPYQENKHIYDQLRKIPWVEGYYSEGKSIQVYVDLLNLEPDWASRQLQLETGQSSEKFHIIHSAQLS